MVLKLLTCLIFWAPIGGLFAAQKWQCRDVFIIKNNSKLTDRLFTSIPIKQFKTEHVAQLKSHTPTFEDHEGTSYDALSLLKTPSQTYFVKWLFRSDVIKDEVILQEARAAQALNLWGLGPKFHGIIERTEHFGLVFDFYNSPLITARFRNFVMFEYLITEKTLSSFLKFKNFILSEKIYLPDILQFLLLKDGTLMPIDFQEYAPYSSHKIWVSRLKRLSNKSENLRIFWEGQLSRLHISREEEKEGQIGLKELKDIETHIRVTLYAKRLENTAEFMNRYQRLQNLQRRIEIQSRFIGHPIHKELDSFFNSPTPSPSLMNYLLFISNHLLTN